MRNIVLHSENKWIGHTFGACINGMLYSGALLALLHILKRWKEIDPEKPRAKRCMVVCTAIFFLCLSWAAGGMLTYAFSLALDSLPDSVLRPLYNQFERHKVINTVFTYFAIHLPWMPTHLLSNKDSEIWCKAIVCKPPQFLVRAITRCIASFWVILFRLTCPVRSIREVLRDNVNWIAASIVGVADNVIEAVSYPILFYFWVNVMIMLLPLLVCKWAARSLCKIAEKRLLMWLGFLGLNVLVSYVTVQVSLFASREKFVITGWNQREIDWGKAGVMRVYPDAFIWDFQREVDTSVGLKKSQVWGMWIFKQLKAKAITVEFLDPDKFSRRPFSSYKMYIQHMDFAFIMHGGTCRGYPAMLAAENIQRKTFIPECKLATAGGNKKGFEPYFKRMIRCHFNNIHFNTTVFKNVHDEKDLDEFLAGLRSKPSSPKATTQWWWWWWWWPFAPQTGFVVIGSHDRDVNSLSKAIQNEFPSAHIRGIRAPSEPMKLERAHAYYMHIWNRWGVTHYVIVEEASTSRFARDPFDRYLPYMHALDGKPLIVALQGGSCKAYMELLYELNNDGFLDDCERNPEVSASWHAKCLCEFALVAETSSHWTEMLVCVQAIFRRFIDENVKMSFPEGTRFRRVWKGDDSPFFSQLYLPDSKK